MVMTLFSFVLNDVVVPAVSVMQVTLSGHWASHRQ